MRLSKKQAAHFLLHRHGLFGEHSYNGKAGALEYIRDIGCVQFDPVDACGKNAELVLHARVEGFQKKHLDELLYTDRALIDYWDKCMCISPVEMWPYFGRMRKACSQGYYSKPEVASGHGNVLEAIRERGACCSSDVELSAHVDWPWGKTGLSRAAMESLFYRGELIVHHKKGTRKYYDLPERYIDVALLNARDPNETPEAYHEWHIKRRIGAVGLLWNKASDAYLGICDLNGKSRNNVFSALESKGEIFPIEVEGIAFPLYVRTNERPLLETIMSGADCTDRLELIAPLDSLLWDRRLIGAVFGFDYRWEIYTPEAQRKYGYYVLPLLFRDEFIGRVEAVNDRKQKCLRVKNVWLESGHKLPKHAFHAYMGRFAAWNGCSVIAMEYERK